jgi:hypothetical protein
LAEARPPNPAPRTTMRFPSGNLYSTQIVVGKVK